jgi:hypothetical protein
MNADMKKIVDGSSLLLLVVGLVCIIFWYMSYQKYVKALPVLKPAAMARGYRADADTAPKLPGNMLYYIGISCVALGTVGVGAVMVMMMMSKKPKV